jgi:hypothetical protein
MERWLEQLERDGLDKTRAYVNSLSSLAYIHAKADQLLPALTVSRRARVLNETLGSNLTLSSQTELEREAHLLFQLGRISEAIEVDRELFRRFASTESSGVPPPTFVFKPAWHSIVGGNADDGTAWLRSALPKYERDGPEATARGVTLDLAAGLVVQARYAEASSVLRRFEARLANGPARPRERMEAARISAEIALATGDLDSLVTSLDLLETALAPNALPHPNALQGYLAAGFGRLTQGDAERARAHASKAATLATANVIDGQSSAWVGAAQLLFARIALEEGDQTAARAHLASAAKQFSDTLHAEHRWRKAVESLSAKL